MAARLLGVRLTQAAGSFPYSFTAYHELWLEHITFKSGFFLYFLALKPGELTSIPQSSVRPLKLRDFQDSLTRVRPSLTTASLQSYSDWNNRFGDIQHASSTGAAATAGETFQSKITSLFSL